MRRAAVERPTRARSLSALLLAGALGACGGLASRGAAPGGMAPAEGTQLYYEVRGVGEPVVLLNGAQLDRRQWDAQFAELSRHFRVVRYDHRGFGRSGRRRKDQPYAAHEDLRALLDHLGIERAHLVGLSLGGRVAIDFALTYPARAGDLALIGPGLSGYPFDTTPPAWLPPLIEAARAGDSVRAALLWLESDYMRPAMRRPELRERLRELSVANASLYMQEGAEVPRSPPAMGRLGEIRSRTLVIVGDQDTPDILAIVDSITRQVPGARKVVVEGAGHVPTMERPDVVNRALLDFLRRP